jgi:hypothetical protein
MDTAKIWRSQSLYSDSWYLGQLRSGLWSSDFKMKYKYNITTWDVIGRLRLTIVSGLNLFVVSPDTWVTKLSVLNIWL